MDRPIRKLGRRITLKDDGASPWNFSQNCKTWVFYDMLGILLNGEMRLNAMISFISFKRSKNVISFQNKYIFDTSWRAKQ